MSTGMIRVLGPVQAEFGGTEVRLTRRRERGLLALLALETGQPVAVERLMGLLLGNRPSANPRAVIQICVSRLRAALAGAGATEHGIAVVRGGGDGYAIRVPRDWVDAHRFTDLLSAARAVSQPGQRADQLRSALGLWRGAALADVDAHLRRVVGARWELLRRSALHARITADLALGVSEILVAELIELAATEPSSEPVAGLLMRALYQFGQRAEALAVFRGTRAYLADALGIEPGDELQQLHRRMLDGSEPATPDRLALRRVAGEGEGAEPVDRQDGGTDRRRGRHAQRHR